MGANTKIDWCDSTWNPVTGCLHGCEYCYARKIAERFGIKPFGHVEPAVLEEPMVLFGKRQPYPLGFSPTFHRYKLDEPQKWKKPRNIFVCSMADLFGDWVPDDWIKAVFDACEKAPQHRYLFLTKNPKRYETLFKLRLPYLDKAMFGYSLETGHSEGFYPSGDDVFMSIEPLLGRLNKSDLRHIALCGWVIVGAETGNRKGKVIPEREWVTEIVDACRECDVPIFMKESLRKLMGNDFKQEFPWQ